MAHTLNSDLTFRVKVIATALVACAVGLNWLPTFDAMAQQYLTDTITSNAIVFGVVRTLNGIISVVQSSEVGVGVAGITIGEIFDPVNDLIERFSGLLLFTLTALGVQQVILFFTTSLAMKLFFSAFAGLIIVLLWFAERHWFIWLRVGLVIVLLRFLLTIEVSFVWLFDWLYFNTTGQEALSVLEASARVIETIKESMTSIKLSELIFGSDSPTLESEDIGTQISESVVTLIVGMLFKSIFIPVGTVWAGYQLAKAGVNQR
jgi:hypothetical protein